MERVHLTAQLEVYKWFNGAALTCGTARQGEVQSTTP